MELVETAQNSAGKSSEQFAKYSDTLEYKINRLKTSWEQLRSNLVNSDTFKKAVDMLSSFVDKIQGIDLKKLLVITPIVLLLAKTFVSTFIDELTKAGTKFKKAGENIGKKIQEGLNRAGEGGKTAAQSFLEHRTGRSFISGAENQGRLDQIEALRNQQKEQAEKFNSTDEQTVRNARSEYNNLQNAIDRLNQSVEQYNQEQEILQTANETTTESLQAVTAATGIFITTLLATGDAEDAFGTMLAAIGAQAASLVTTFVSTATSAASTAYASSASVGAAIGEGLNAGLAATGIGLIIVAVAAAISAIGLGIAHMVKLDNEQRDVAKNLENATEKLEEAEANASAARSAIKENEDTKKSLQDSVEEYNKLANKVLKTTEEQERLTELTEEIKEKYPEIIAYQNEENDQLVFSNSLMQDKLDKLDEEIEKQKELATYNEALKTSTSQEVEYYENIGRVNDITGLELDVKSAKNSPIFQALTHGEDITFNNQGVNNSDYDLSLFTSAMDELAKNVLYPDNEYSYGAWQGGVDEGRYNELINAWNYIYDSSEENLEEYLQNIDSDWYETIKKMRDEVEELRKTTEHFDENLKLTQENIKQVYGDESESKQNIRAVVGAIRLGEKGTYEDLDLEDTGGNSGFNGNIDLIDQQLGFSEDASTRGIKNLFDKVSSGLFGGKNNFSKMEESLSAEGSAMLAELGLDTEEAYKKFLEEYGDSDKRINEELTKRYWAKRMSEITGSEELYEINDALLEQMSSLSEDYADKSIEELGSSIDSIKQGLIADGINEVDANKIIQEILPDITALKEQEQALVQIYGNYVKGTSVTFQNALNQFYNDAVDKLGNEQLAKDYAQSIGEILDEAGLSEEEKIPFLQIDFSTLTDPSDFEEWRQNLIDQFGLAGDEAGIAMLDKVLAKSKDIGIIDLQIDSPQELDNFIDKLNEAQKSIYDLQDTFISSMVSQATEGEVALKDFLTMQEKLGEMNLDAYDYFSIDENGKITTDAEKLKQLYIDQVASKKDELKLKISEMEVEKIQLENQLQQLDSIINAGSATGELINFTIDYNNSLPNIIDNWVQIVNLIRESQNQGPIDTSTIKKNTINTGYFKLDSKTLEQLKKQRDALQSQADILENTIETTQHRLENLDNEGAAYIRDFENQYNESLESAKEKTEETSDAVDELNEKIKELNETLYGTENFNAASDNLYNYTTALEKVQTAAQDTKEALENFEGSDKGQLFNDYANELHQEAVLIQAENQVIQKSIDNIEKQTTEGLKKKLQEINAMNPDYHLSTDASDYFKKDEFSGQYIIDYNKINNAQMNDEFKTWLAQQLEQANEYQKTLRDNAKVEQQRRQEIQDMREKYLNDYVSLEDKVLSTLKEKYQEEIDATKGKYEAMSDADNDYLDALEEAIEKQRNLRDSENKWNDLAQKERKLSLMQRDTSGGNRTDVLKLQEEIQDDRQELLDDKIDSIVDNLRDTYELQKEWRDKEIEMLELQLDEAVLSKEAAAIVSSWQSPEDVVNWFYDNTKDLPNWSNAKLEQQMMEWSSYYEQKNLYDNFNGSALESALITNSQEITNAMDTYSNTAINEAERSLNETSDKVVEAINNAQSAVQEAINNMNQGSSGGGGSWTNGSGGSSDGGTSTDELSSGYKTRMEAQRALESLAQTGAGGKYKNLRIQQDADGTFSVHGQAPTNSGSTSITKSTKKDNKVFNSYSEAKNALESILSSGGGGKYDNKNSKVIDNKDGTYSYVVKQKTIDDKKPLAQQGVSIQSAVSQGVSYYKSQKKDKDIGQTTDHYSFNKDDFKKGQWTTAEIMDDNGNTKKLYGDYMSDVFHFLLKYLDRQGYFVFGNYGDWINANYGTAKYANGGLVNYTGPAWVDGTPQNPEAFLSSEDTQRIGEAAKLLSSIPLLNNKLSTNQVNSQIVGDTNIEVHINVESISSDYDVDEAVERVKYDIIQASNKKGSSVILKK